MSDDAPRQDLDALQARLTELDERPVSEHPDVLDAVHATVAAELDALTIPRAESRAAAPPTGS